MYIYSITNKVNGNQYVGKTVETVERRWKQHKKSIDLLDCVIYRAMRKYGLDNFFIETIEKVDGDNELLLEREIHWIKTLDTYKNGYNMTKGGEGTVGYKHNDETKQKLRESRKGKTHDEETKRKMSETRKGKPKSKEWSRKIGEAQMGEKNHRWGKTPWNKGIVRDKSACIHCQKMVDAANLKRWHNDNCKSARP